MPERIQRKRTKGWRMPPNTVYVGRPTKWGNPFKVYGDLDWQGAVDSFRMNLEEGLETGTIGLDFLTGLRGKNLACFCSLDHPCHADVLLELANATTDASGTRVVLEGPR